MARQRDLRAIASDGIAFAKPACCVYIRHSSIYTSNAMASKSSYYTDKELTTWERVKKAFANDWEQTRSDFGSDEARDMDQDVDDTLKQAAGADNAFENHEQAFRFGYTANQRYAKDYPEWSNDLDARLKKEYEGDYAADCPYIRHSYQYKPKG